MKTKMIKIMQKIVFMLLYSFILFGIGFVVALVITKRTDSTLQDAMFLEGLLVCVIGIFAFMKGNPSGLSISGMGRSGETGVSLENLETTRLERQYTNYYSSFLKHSIVEFTKGGTAIFLCGLLLIAFSIFFL